MYDELLDLQNELKKIIENASSPDKILEIGAKDFVKDLLKLTKPISKIKAMGYTHLIDTFTYTKSNKRKNEIEVCWGKYYGPFVERGTRLQKGTKHLAKTYEKNKEKYYKKMINQIY